MQYYLFQTSSYIKLTTHGRRYVVTKKPPQNQKKPPETPLPPKKKKPKHANTENSSSRIPLMHM